MVRGWKFIHPQRSLQRSACLGAVVLYKPIPVRAVGKGNIQHVRIAQRLLHPGAHIVMIVLGFDDRQGMVFTVEQNIVGTVSHSACHPFSPYMDLPEGELLIELGDIPAGHVLDGRRDEFCANITLREAFLSIGP